MNRLHQLAVSDEGFVFDPTTGESFRLNQTGLFILRALKENRPDQEIAQQLAESFEVSPEDAARDITDFMDHLKIHALL